MSSVSMFDQIDKKLEEGNRSNRGHLGFSVIGGDRSKMDISSKGLLLCNELIEEINTCIKVDFISFFKDFPVTDVPSKKGRISAKFIVI